VVRTSDVPKIVAGNVPDMDPLLLSGNRMSPAVDTMQYQLPKLSDDQRPLPENIKDLIIWNNTGSVIYKKDSKESKPMINDKEMLLNTAPIDKPLHTTIHLSPIFLGTLDPKNIPYFAI
jgi:hypothetical protein